MAVNVRAVLVISQVVARGMIARAGGAIVNRPSQASQAASTDHAAYCASKGALDQLALTNAEDEHTIPAMLPSGAVRDE